MHADDIETIWPPYAESVEQTSSERVVVINVLVVVSACSMQSARRRPIVSPCTASACMCHCFPGLPPPLLSLPSGRPNADES